jgi:hypothetical protein
VKEEGEMSEDPQEEFTGPYIGRSKESFAAAARNADEELVKRHGRAPNPPITFKADCFVTIGNPIHEFIIELSRNP